MKSYEEIMDIVEAFDLTGSYRDAGELAGCSHHTVARYVQLRDEGRMPVPGEVVERPKLTEMRDSRQGDFRGAKSPGECGLSRR